MIEAVEARRLFCSMINDPSSLKLQSARQSRESPACMCNSFRSKSFNQRYVSLDKFGDDDDDEQMISEW